MNNEEKAAPGLFPDGFGGRAKRLRSTQSDDLAEGDFLRTLPNSARTLSPAVFAMRPICSLNVRVGLESQPSRLASTFHHPSKPGRGEWRTAFTGKPNS
jgi:hypothetical protein